jgi:hypothetical protein
MFGEARNAQPGKSQTPHVASDLAGSGGQMRRHGLRGALSSGDERRHGSTEQVR